MSTNTTSAVSNEALTITDNAANKVRALLKEEGNSDLKLRVYVAGGGCSGFQYGFKFDENVNEGDTEVTNGDISVVVDPMSIQYLEGSSIDFVDGLQGSQFVIHNPNAATTCGCGSSFSI